MATYKKEFTWNAKSQTFEWMERQPKPFNQPKKPLTFGEILMAPFTLLFGIALIAAILIIPIAWLLFPIIMPLLLIF